MKLTTLRISGTALDAERARLEAISENLANAHTTRGPDGRAYRRKQVVFRTIPENEPGGGGVRVAESRVSLQPLPQVRMPDHPDADPITGIVEFPNVNEVEEMVDMLAATRAYEANIGVVNATKNLVSKALEMGR
jgi:flagellar basal-body rod protein FlgC